MHIDTLAKAGGITRARAERFILELANVHPSKDAVDRLLNKFPEFFPDLDDPGVVAAIHKEPYRRLIRDVERQLQLAPEQSPKVAFVFFLSYSLLQEIWNAPEEWTAYWKILATLLLYNNLSRPRSGVAGTPDDPLAPPPWTPFTVAMTYLSLILERTRRCKNPSCKAMPFFFARKKGQEYCSDACAAEAQREYKRKWWAEHGKQWRKERKK